MTARRGETLLQVADRAGVEIPRLCYSDGLRAAGNCCACVVEVEGERTPAPVGRMASSATERRVWA